MMKMRMLWILLVISTLMVISGCSNKPDPLPIPADAMLYLQADNLEDNWGMLKTRKFFTEAAQWKLWQEPFMEEITATFYDFQEDFEKNTKLPLNETTFMMIFGKKVDIAVIPAEPFPAVIVVADLGSKSAPLKLISKSLKNLDPEKISKYKCLDHEITAVKTDLDRTPGSTIATEILFTFHKNYIIASSSRSGIRKSLKIIEEEAESLDLNQDYIKMRDSIDESSVIIYADPVRLADQVIENNLITTDEKTVPIRIKSVISGINVTKSGLHLVSSMLPIVENENFLETLYLDSDATNNASQWIPSKSIAGAACALNLPNMVKHQQEILSKIETDDGTELWTSLTETLQAFTGLDIPAELELWGGDGAFFCFEKIRMISVVPVPELALGFQVKDTMAAGNFIDSMKTRLPQGFAVKKMVDVSLPGNNVYTYASIPLLAGFQPGYALIDDFLIFSTSASTVTSLQMARNGDEQRFELPRFSSLTDNSDENLFACKAVDPRRFAEDAGKALDNLGLFITAADQDPAVYREILSTLNNIPGIGLQVKFTDDMIVYDGVIEIL